MGQVLIGDLDDQVIAAYRAMAARNKRPLAVELCAALTSALPKARPPLKAIMDRLEAIRAMTPKNVKQTPAEELRHENTSLAIDAHSARLFDQLSECE